MDGEPEPEHEDEDDPTEELRATLVSTYDIDFGLPEVRWISRFTHLSRQPPIAPAAYSPTGTPHNHPPHGLQGLGTGVQDAVNLG